MAESIGPNRVVAARAVTHPLGNPSLPSAEERAFRRELIQKALDLLQTETSEPVVARLEDR